MPLSWAGRSCTTTYALHAPTPLTLIFVCSRIYGVRTVSSKIFEYRITRIQRRLDDYHKQREETIEKLKIATKYNSTQQLLEKYGGEPPKSSPAPKGDIEKRTPAQQPQHVARTGLPPPPTANIRPPPSASQPLNNLPSPQPSSPPAVGQGSPQIPQQPLFAPSLPPQVPTDQASFAPNAFSQNGDSIEQPHWYDRLLDVLLGEDETQARNRMVLICNECRLVNGQVPPGIKTPEELGRWRCGSCRAWNGVESEATKMLSSLRQDTVPAEGTWEPVSKADVDTQSSEDMEEDAMVAWSEEEQPEPVGSVTDNQTEQEERTTESEPVRRSKRVAKGDKAKE